ncbi:MAG: nuclear transport factor 2 family protein [Erysipelotrichaceae bacterium]|jgi:ketosteroid isomerase-like protein|nr:nuclear transport factor 2 family protein [Erysipelotrichaceae bacterium]
MKQILKEYFDSWISKDVEVVKRTFANDVVYTECYGPQYHGLDQVVRWFNDWNENDSVLEWTIKRTIEKENTIVVEWYFKCDCNNKVSGFDGVTIADFDENGKIVRLSEFRSDSDHIYPYD